MLRDSTVVAVVRTCPRAILLAMITMRKSTHGFPFVSHIWDAYASGCQSSAIILLLTKWKWESLGETVNLACQQAPTGWV